MDEQKKSTEEKMKEVGTKMQRLGCAMTFMFTIPILGVVFFGIPGLLIGLLIAVIGIAGMWKSDDKNKKPDNH